MTFTVDTIKGVEYAFFSAVAGTYTATYAADTGRPTVTSISPASGAIGVSQATTGYRHIQRADGSQTTITTSTVALRDPANAVVPGRLLITPRPV